MSNHDRAAQFAPYAALVGYYDDVSEAERIVEKEIELGEFERQQINEALAQIQASIKEKPLIKITYFIPDKRKVGGEYITEEHVIRLIDDVNKVLITNKNKKIRIDRILTIEIL